MSILSRAAVLTLLGVVAFVGGVVADLAINGGAWLNVVTGRAGIEDACLPALEGALAAQGFAPSAIVLADRPDLWLRYRADPEFTSAFTFEDGPDERRVDGRMVCHIEGGRAKIEAATGSRPVRTG